MALNEPRDLNLEIGLLAIRVTSAGLFLIWSIDKLFNPEHTQAVFKTYYFSEISQQLALGLGVMQTAVILAFLIGAFKTWTYGAMLVMHTLSVASTWDKLITPYADNRQILFWGTVPAVAALLLLFLVRKRDRLWSV